MKIELQHFWKSHTNDFHPDFNGDVTKSFLIDLVTTSIPDATKDVLLSSVYANRGIPKRISRQFSNALKPNLEKIYGQDDPGKPAKGKINIWYTAENTRPPLNENWDVFWSFEKDFYDKRNRYLPLWVTRLGKTLIEADECQNKLMQERCHQETRKELIAAVISNPERIRGHLISELSDEIPIKVFGKLGAPIENKKEALLDFRMNLCFENDLYPGYVTEKPFEAYLAGCIPIWRGLDRDAYLNPEAIIDATNLSTSETVELIKKVSKDSKKLEYMSQLPILNKKVPIFDISSSLRDTYSKS